MVIQAGIAKTAGTVGASAVMLGFGAWAWAFAVIGVAFSLYLEPASTPKKALHTVIEILGWGFVAALLCITLPHFHWFGIGDFLGRVPMEARAGLFGVSVRWGVNKGKKVLANKAKKWSDE